MSQHGNDKTPKGAGQSWIRKVYLDPLMTGERVAIGLAAVNDVRNHLVVALFDPKSLATVIGVSPAREFDSIVRSGLQIIEEQLQRRKNVAELVDEALAGLHLGPVDCVNNRDLVAVMTGAATMAGLFGGGSRFYPVSRGEYSNLVGNA